VILFFAILKLNGCSCSHRWGMRTLEGKLLIVTRALGDANSVGNLFGIVTNEMTSVLPNGCSGKRRPLTDVYN
jgi:hypothetical protein